MVKVSILFVFSIVIIFSFFKQKMTIVFTIANMQWQPDQIIRPPAQLNVLVKTHRYNTKLHKMWISGEQSATGSHSEPGIASLCPPYHPPSSSSSYLKQNHHQLHNATPPNHHHHICSHVSPSLLPSRRYLPRIRLSSPDYQQWSAPLSDQNTPIFGPL